MSYTFYMSIEGTKQGKLKGEIATGLYKDKAPCLRFHYGVESSRDVSSGHAVGKREHQPLVVLKEIGVATPQVFQACVTNEVLRTVLFEFTWRNPEGQDEVYYTIKLTNATVAAHKHLTAPESMRTGENDVLELEEIAFRFERISLEHKTGKTLASDEWAQ
jgi:type VI secretion system secreted protein Hcp